MKRWIDLGLLLLTVFISRVQSFDVNAIPPADDAWEKVFEQKNCEVILDKVTVSYKIA